MIFIYFYNKRKPDNAISLSGWPYFFFVVVIAFLSWLPAEFVVTQFTWNDYTEASEVSKKLVQITVIALISIFFSVIWLLLTQIEFIANLIFSPFHDNFYKKCIEWAYTEVFLNLKTGKVYRGLLWKYPENPNSRCESQTISIVPFHSGYRDDKTKEVIWNIHYPEYEEIQHFFDMEVIIPRSEIVTFGKFSIRTFEHFKR